YYYWGEHKRAPLRRSLPPSLPPSLRKILSDSPSVVTFGGPTEIQEENRRGFAMPMTKAEMKVQLDEARASVESFKQEVNRITKEKDALAARVEEVTELRATIEELRRETQGDATGDLEDQLAETRWRLEESERESEVAVLRAKETTREELQQTHKRELESSDYLIQLLREKVEQLQQQVETTGDGARRRPTGMRFSETLTKFNGEDVDDEGAFLRWLRKLEWIAEL
uniref:Uncharacterized protein n=2 Tax=Amphimedon queenslandica TaxID=400682 RepID=A0A1X7URP4_AMPQE